MCVWSVWVGCILFCLWPPPPSPSPLTNPPIPLLSPWTAEFSSCLSELWWHLLVGPVQFVQPINTFLPCRLLSQEYCCSITPPPLPLPICLLLLHSITFYFLWVLGFFGGWVGGVSWNGIHQHVYSSVRKVHSEGGRGKIGGKVYGPIDPHPPISVSQFSNEWANCWLKILHMSACTHECTHPPLQIIKDYHFFPFTLVRLQ